MDDESPTGRGGPADLPGVRPVSQVSERMQTLLSRAVEEQVSEQKAVSAVLADLRGQVAALGDTVRKGASEAAVARLGGSVDTVVADLRTATSVLGQRLDALAGRVDAVAVDVTGPSDTVAERLTVLTAEVTAHSEAVQALQGALAAVPTALAAVQTDVVAALRDEASPALVLLGLAGLREDVDDLAARLAESAGPSADEVAAAVTQRLSEGLLDALAPRVAQVVLDRLGEDLVAQVADALATRLRADTAAVIQAANADSERRVVAHVDDSVLALAEALLRRRRAGRHPASPEPEAPVVAYPAEDDRYPAGVHQDELPQEQIPQEETPQAEIPQEEIPQVEIQGEEVQREEVQREEIQLEEVQLEEVQLEEVQPEEAPTAPAGEPLVEPTPDLDDAVHLAQDEESLADTPSSDSGDAGEDLGGVPAPLPSVPPPLARPSVPTLTAASARWTMPTEQGTAGRRRPWWRPGG